MEEHYPVDISSLEPQFNHGGSLRLLQDLLAEQLDVELLRIATAYFGVLAMLYLEEYVENVSLRLLMGFGAPERAEQSVDPLFHFEQSVRQGVSDNVLHAAQILLDAIEGQGIVIKVFESRFRRDLHAKVYITNINAALVGSANFTKGGMESNVEALHPVTDPDHVFYYLEQFEYFWNAARDITIFLRKSSAFLFVNAKVSGF